jgi:hypothetical protein
MRAWAYAVASLFACLPLLAAPPDPWARVPPLPTGCYGADGFAQTLQAARESVARDRARQETVNRELSDRAKTVDPMELARRQQQYMMEHPQEAMQMMQDSQRLGETATDAGLLDDANRKKLETELREIDGRYRAAMDRAIGPLDAKFKELDARAQTQLVPLGEMWDYPAWAIQEWNQLTLAENAAYEKVCAEWWAATGPYHGWLRRYRAHLVEDQIPYREESERVAAGFLVVLVGTPTASFEPTATLVALEEYMGKTAEVLARRRPEPGRTREKGILELPPRR